MKEQEAQKPKPIVEAPKTSIEQREKADRELLADQVQAARMHE